MAQEPNTKTFKAAGKLLAAGVSIIPTRPADKVPAVSTWKQYQEARPSAELLPGWFHNGNGLAILGGAISGNLLVLDFDHPGLYEQFRQRCEDHDIDALELCAVVESPSGGNHVYLRSASPVGHSDKIAFQTFEIPAGTDEKEVAGRRYALVGSKSYLIVSVRGEDQYVKCVIETRGEGGYAVTFPTPGYKIIRGRTDELPVLPGKTVDALLDVAASFNTYQPAEHYPEPARVTVERDGMNTPGNDYNARGDYEQLLQDHGWTPLHRSGPKTTWMRPGKDEHEVSATTGLEGARMLYVFSTNAPPFDPQRKYAPFSIYALLEHAGDFSAAAKQLGIEGYGDPPIEKFVRPRAKKKSATVAEREKEQAENDQSKQYLYALAWAELNRDRFIYLTGDQWFEYHDGYWEYSSSEDVQRSVQEYLATVTSVTAALVSNVRTLAKSMVGPHKLSDFNAHSNWIPLQNGVLDTITGELLPHSPDNRLTYQAHYDYIPDASCPTLLRCLDEWLVDTNGNPCKEWHDAMQEWAGYCLIPDNTAQLSMMWVGEAGANGKGTTTRLFEKLIGEEFTTAISIEQLHDPYFRAELYGKLVGFVNEPDPRAMNKNGNHFKAITGGDKISARRPTEKVFTFTSLARVIISCNTLPANKDLSGGYYRRLLMIDWRCSVPADKRDPLLDDKLAAELPGILNWALAGLARWRGRGRKFIIPKESSRLLEEYRMEQDTLRKFIAERCVVGKGAEILNTQFYTSYKNACEEWGDKPEPGKAVSARLAKLGHPCVPTWVPEMSKTLRLYKGIDVSSDQNEP